MKDKINCERVKGLEGDRKMKRDEELGFRGGRG